MRIITTHNIDVKFISGSLMTTSNIWGKVCGYSCLFINGEINISLIAYPMKASGETN